MQLQYKSKYNRTRLNEVVLLMITDGVKWHYLALKSIPASGGYMRPTQNISRLFNKITSSNTTNDYYCLNCFHSHSTENKLKEHEVVCENHNHCEVVMPDDRNKILKYATGSKSLKMTHAIYVDIECQLVKHDTCTNNINKSWSTDKNTHIPTGYTINKVNEFKDNYHIYYRGKDCVTKLSKDLINIGKEILNEEKKPMIPLTDDEKIKHKGSKRSYLCDQSFNINKESKYYMNYKKVRDHCHYTGKYRGAAHSICNLRYQEQRDIPVIIHSGSNYDFHLLIKDLAKEFKSDIYCIGENTEKYISFSIPIPYHNKKIDNETINYNLKFIDSYSFLDFSLDSLVHNLSEIQNKSCIRCKERNKTIQPCEFVKLDDHKLMYRCLECKHIS